MENELMGHFFHSTFVIKFNFHIRLLIFEIYPSIYIYTFGEKKYELQNFMIFKIFHSDMKIEFCGKNWV